MDLPASLRDLPPDRPVLIAGPTASGKSALALALAATQGGIIVNADALQVYAGWPLLTAQPTPADLARARHALYGHLPHDAAYSVGAWLADVEPLLTGPVRPIITGGTGLYFHALTRGLAVIPPTPPAIRVKADTLSLPDLLAPLDPATRDRIDTQNRARVQRAWEVLQATGRPLSAWQDDTPAPRLPLSATTAVVLRPDPAWLNVRIETRFDTMLAAGALDEARAMLPHWNPAHLSSRAIGAADLIAHLQGRLTLSEARAAAITASRQYAKRQRTWFRNRMQGWTPITLPALPGPS
jgi:tRNA dimethylallyltransferase